MKIKHIFTLLYIIFGICSVSEAQLNRSDLRDQIRLLSQDTSTDTSKQKWSDAQLNTRITMGHLEVTRRSRCLQRTTYYAILKGTRAYVLPPNLLLTERVAYFQVGSTDVYERLNHKTLLGLDDEDSLWMNEGDGKPRDYYIWGSSINIHPAASASYEGADRLRIDYIKKPDTLTDSTYPFDNEPHLYPYHPILIYYVVALCEKDRGDFRNAQYFEQQYYNMLGLMMNEVQSKPDYFPDFSFMDYK